VLIKTLILELLEQFRFYFMVNEYTQYIMYYFHKKNSKKEIYDRDYDDLHSIRYFYIFIIFEEKLYIPKL